MKIWISTIADFPSFELISIGCAAESGETFYEAIHCEDLSKYAIEKFLPSINKKSIPYANVRHALVDFLIEFNNLEIIANDLDCAKYMLQLICMPYRKTLPPISIKTFDVFSIPDQYTNNALDNAKTLMRLDQKTKNIEAGLI